jgi:hypothetical protein
MSREEFSDSQEKLSAAVIGAEEQLIKLKQAVLETYKNMPSAVANIKTRLDQKIEALSQKVISGPLHLNYQSR